MKTINHSVLFAFVLFFNVNALASSTSNQADSDTFWQALQQGGKVVLLRHAAIDKEFASPFTLDASCFSERNLNELGQHQATTISEAFKAKNVNIQQVLSSPYCRTKETAELAFGKFTVNKQLHLTKSLAAEKAADNVKAIQELIGNYSSQKGNLVLVTHRPNILDIANVNTQPADMVLLNPLGEGLFEVIVHLKNTITEVK